MFVNLSEYPLPPIFGVQQDPAGPVAELRVLFEKADHPLAARLPDALYLNGRYQVLKPTAENTETLLYADWHYGHTPVLTQRAVGRGRVASAPAGRPRRMVCAKAAVFLLVLRRGRTFQTRTSGWRTTMRGILAGSSLWSCKRPRPTRYSTATRWNAASR